MVGLTIQNYFAAILDNSLELEVGDILINKDTLETLFTDHDIIEAVKAAGCHDDFETSYAYYKALTHDLAIVEVVDIENLGKVKMTILVDRELPRQVVFNRNGMKITDRFSGLKRFRMVKPFACVVEPVEQSASEILRQMEPPAHDDFLPHHASDHTVARRILKSLEVAVKTFVDNHAGYTASQESNITELSDMLADTTDEQNGDRGEYNINGEIEIRDESKIIGFGGRKYGTVSVGTMQNDGDTETVSGQKNVFDGDPNDTDTLTDGYGTNDDGVGHSISSPAHVDMGGKDAVSGQAEGKKAVRMHVKHRGVFKGKRVFKLQTSVSEPVKLEIEFKRNGLTESTPLHVVSSSNGLVVNGKVQVELDKNSNQIEVTFDRDFRGGSVGIVAHAI